MTGIDQYVLLDLVAAVARQVCPDSPADVSARAFEAAVSSDKRFAALPRARSLTRLFAQPWRELVKLSLIDNQTRAKTLAHRAETCATDWFTAEQATFALRLICRRLGGTATFSPGDYRRERDTLTRSSRARATMPSALPTENQIITIFKSWDAALTAAGIQTASLQEGALVETSGRARAGTSAIPRLTIIEVLGRCYEAHGTQPTFGELALFAQANRIPFPRKQIGRPWDGYLHEWKDMRRAPELPVPEGPPPKRDRPDYSQAVDAARKGERRLTGWNEELIVQWVVKFLDQLPRGRRPTERAYADWVSGTPGAPGQSTLQRHGGFTNFIRLAQRARLR